MTLQYHNEHTVLAKTPAQVRAAVRKLHTELGNVEIFIEPHKAFDGCAAPLRVKAGDIDTLADEQLTPICEDYPLHTAAVTPVY